MIQTYQNNKKRKYRYHWSLKRFAKNMLLLLIIICFGAVLGTTLVKATYGNTQPQIIEIKVLHGDTLWSIAQKLEPDSDPRLVIHRIKEMNRLEASNLEIGQSLAYQVPK